MEIQDVGFLTERWKAISDLSEKMFGYVHDQDAKIRSLIRSMCDKPEFVDPIRMLKGINVTFDVQP
jgi:hypothetical protein